MEDKNKIIYLMLGLGIGIIIANILHSFYPKYQLIDLSDDQIIERATELGMVKLKESIKIKKEPVEEKEEEIAEEKEDEVLVVKSGSDLTTVAKQLYKLGLIVDEEEFIFYVRDEGLDRKIITGTYSIKYNTPYSEIIKIITEKAKNKD